MEDKIREAYDEYLSLPKATLNGANKNAEMYSEQWCVLTGKSCCHPHPHRHYTLLEFAFWLGKNNSLYKKFIDD